jgi:subtilisin family serine protease
VLNLKAVVLPLLAFTIGCGAVDFDPFDQLEKLSTVIFAPEYPTRFTESVPNSYIVVFRTAAGSDRLAFPNYYSEYKFHYNLLAEKHFSDPRVKDIQFLSAVDLAKPERQNVISETMMPKALTLQWDRKGLKSIVGAMARVDFSDRNGSRTLLKEWEKKEIIWFAEPNWISHLSAEPTGDAPATPTPPASTGFKAVADAYTKSSSPWLSPMNIAKGFQIIASRIAAGTLTESALSESAPVIAVMDSGVDYEHPALKNHMWVNDNEGQADCPGDTHGCDTTVNVKGSLGAGSSVHPYGLDEAGKVCDASDGSPVSKAIEGNCHHGTHVAGIVAGEISGEPSVPGICPYCQIMVIKVVSAADSPGGGIPDSALLNGMRYVTLFVRGGTNVVRVINASLGKFQRARGVTLLVSQLAHNGSGTLLIGAAGNEDTNSRQYPAANTDAIAVSSVSAESSDLGKKARYSNFGPWVDIAAPGGTDASQIESTVPGGGTAGEEGTSMASPMVAGVAGMLLAVDPTLRADDLRALLLSSADQSIYENETNQQFYLKQFSGDTVTIPLLGAGVVDLEAALSGTVQGLPIEAYLNSRVSAGCGIITIPTPGGSCPEYLLLSILFLLCPILVVARSSKKV